MSFSASLVIIIIIVSQKLKHIFSNIYFVTFLSITGVIKCRYFQTLNYAFWGDLAYWVYVQSSIRGGDMYNPTIPEHKYMYCIFSIELPSSENLSHI